MTDRIYLTKNMCIGNVKGANFLDPLVSLIGSFVIVSWGCQLLMDTSSSLLDMCPDMALVEKLKHIMEKDNQTVVDDLHIWKVGPGHLSVMVAVTTSNRQRNTEYYANKLKCVKAISHHCVQISYS